jgi:AraC family transcriptional regulator, activator of mtrCDE
VLADAPGRTPVPLEEVMATTGYKGEGTFVISAGNPKASTQMVCGHFTFADSVEHPLLNALPALIHLTDADRTCRPILDDILSLVVRRMFEDSPGQAASVSRLSEVLYIETLLACADRTPELKGVLSAVSDRQIGRALSLIHHHIEQNWSVASLASEAGMSRSRFAERFRELMGVSPKEYITNWRLQRAHMLLSEPRASVKETAHKVGYRSSAAFSRAFSHKFGRPPGARKKNIG